MKQEIINKINKAVEKANQKQSEINDFCIGLDGMSSQKIRHFLNNIVDDDDTYLEIGTWKGSTLISALYPRKCKKYWAIDDFSQFNDGDDRKDVKGDFFKNFKTAFNEEPNFINSDCYAINPIDYGMKDINVFLYDGNHTRECQKKALTHYYDYLANDFIYLVDDWSTIGWGVQEGTMDAIFELDLKVHLRLDMPGRIGDTPAPLDQNWWFGFGILYLEK